MIAATETEAMLLELLRGLGVLGVVGSLFGLGVFYVAGRKGTRVAYCGAVHFACLAFGFGFACLWDVLYGGPTIFSSVVARSAVVLSLFASPILALTVWRHR